MELASKITERNKDLSILYQQLSTCYNELESEYKSQKQVLIEYKHKANYWEAQFHQVKTREELLKGEIEELKAQLYKREHQLFGRSSEKGVTRPDTANISSATAPAKKNRGQQVGSKGHGRRDFSHLPTVEEEISLLPNHAYCRCCGLPYEELEESEDSEILEVINVQAYRRLIRRKRYKRSCKCSRNKDPQIITPPPSERLLPKSKIGISIWALLLLNKYEYQQPLNRVLEQLSNQGLSLAMGTLTDGLKKLLPYFIPIYDAIGGRNVSSNHWHADETGWKVYELIEDKKNHRWFLWIFQNEETVYYKISPTRSSEVLVDHFGNNHPGGILNVDRYAAYKVIAKTGLFILAFCWAHVRRDFLGYAKGYAEQESWALAWVEKIAELYHINNQRIEFEKSSKKFNKLDQTLRKTVTSMAQELYKQYEDKSLLPSARKILKSLKDHWDGLTVFVDYPEIPMDNNQAERGLRPSVVGRKNYYGSGSIWSAQLAAALFTIFKTIKLWNINPHTWLLAYLQECAMHAGPPKNIDHFLPWHMPTKVRELFARPPKHEEPIIFDDG
jgi:transposase